MARLKPDIETFQTPFEIDQLVGLFERLNPQRVLEVGCWHGGTLWHWLTAPHVVVVDDTMRKRADWVTWGYDAGTDLHLLQGFSNDPLIVEQVRDLGPYDFVFIDADHGYDNVTADRDNYLPMIQRGGVAVFHDILGRPDYGVERVWGEIKASGRPTIEIVQDATSSYCGIGVVWV